MITITTNPNNEDSGFLKSFDPIKMQDDMQKSLYTALFSNSLSLQIENNKYTPDITKEGNKRLISRCNPEDKEIKKTIRKCMGKYLSFIFAIREKPLDADALFGKSMLHEKRQFSIKNENELDSYEIFTEVGDGDRFIIKNRKEYISMNAQEKEIFSKNVILSLFNGSRCEIFPVPDISYNKSSDYWNDWWEKETNQITHYREVIYPLMSGAVLNTLQLLVKQNQSPLMIMELAGGNGELAEIILNHDQYPKNARYVFLELNEPSVEAAKTKLKEFPNVEICQTDLIKDEAYGTVAPSSVDVVLGSGILTRCVLSKKEKAQTILKKVFHYLKNEGYLILAGHAEMLLNANDFKRAGFEVINCTANGRQLYILQKPSPFERICSQQGSCAQQ